MILFCVAVFTFGFYAVATPFKFVLYVHISAQMHLGAGLSAFEGRFALRQARQRALGEKRHWPWKKAEMDLRLRESFRSLLKSAACLRRHAHLEKFCMQGQIASENAARTALLWGCANALQASALPFATRTDIQVQLEADFSSNESDIHLYGMVSIRLGHIICAALIGAWNYFARRISHGKTSD